MLINSKNNQYIAALDGLRAFAVLAVFAYHLGLSWAGGGFLGVDIFFVISGYLITSNILLSLESEDGFSLQKFWIGRIRRLIPAAYVMIITTFMWVTFYNGNIVTETLWDGLSSIFYANNWWFIFHKVSYFDSFGSPSPFKNLWSLAVEEQFYIVWPILMLIGLKVFKRRMKFAKIIFIGALCSATLMAILYKPGMDPSRVYYGTDTRAFELLIGSLLAIICPTQKLLSRKISIKKKKELNITGIITFAVFVLSVVYMNEYQTFIYRGGMLLICLNTAVLIVCISHRNSYLSGLFSWKPLRWVGKRSYGIYLWHYPIIVLSTPVHEIGNIPYWRMCMQLVITFIIAELSYRFIEMPIRKYGFRGFLRKYRSTNTFKRRRIAFTTITSLLIVFFMIGCDLHISTISTSAGQQIDMPQSSQSEKITNNKDASISTNTDISSDKNNEVSTNTDISSDKNNESSSSTKTKAKSKSYNGILAIGDSIMLDIEPRLTEMYPNITVDGKVGRQLSQVIEPPSAYKTFNDPNKAVIIELGTNGYFTDKQLDSLLNHFSEAHIFLVNIRVPRQWENEVNKVIDRKAKENKNITLIDWHSASINNPEYFSSDGVHLQPKGIEALTSLIDQALINQD
ncbi:acyltransferase family protein [Clostridium estertheticum]|uniref:acyltransferase family protein n=1 Tax=Clostridium estertheticum TaxID=238834 RepID=UPI0013E94679|nr:acyltransferase family protein [Clostridium estertheticum]MBZ9685205.1 acyltransferase family protein [Clostridium estertheticum]